MEYTYKIRADKITNEKNQEHIVYGADVFYRDKLIRSIPDVFLDKAKMEKFIKISNSLRLSIIHLPGVIEDALA